jgi:uncharacterized membrane protein YhaH (DUF805 family)/glutaredoxin
MEQYTLVFSGDILPGNDPEETRARLIALLGVAPEKSARLFSGKPVVIKKGLSADAAQAYRRKLASMGIGVRVEVQNAAPPTPPAVAPAARAVDTETPVTATSALEPSLVAIEEMQCPECGQSQPKRTLCMHCGVDMPRILAAREQQKEEAAMPGGFHSMESIRVYDQAPAYTQAPDRPPYFGLNFDARMSRRAYFTGWCLMSLAAFTSMMFIVLIGAKWLAIPVVVVFVVMGLRLSVLRTHDFNWSGWWVLLSFIPVVGVVFSLLLLFFPGSPGDNDFGEKPESASWGHALGALAAMFVVPAAIALIAPAFIAKGVTQFSGPGNSSLSDNGAMANVSMDLEGYDPALNDLVMYSLTTCGYCAQKRAQFDALGVHYIEVFIDTDEGARMALMTKLDAIGYRDRGVGTPTIEINGVMLPNNPSLDEIARHFYRRRT